MSIENPNFGQPEAEKAPIEEQEKAEESMRTAFETKEGEKFFAERLISPEDPRVEKVQEIFEGEFGKEELDPVEVLKQAMTGKMETGEKVPPYLVNVVENSRGEIKGVSTGAVVETVNDKREVSEKSGVSLGCYFLTSPDVRGKLKIPMELWKLQEQSAKNSAEDRGLKIKGYLAEAHNSVEAVLNRLGVKQAYIKTKEDFRELPYEQPPVDWDPKTGKPGEDAGIVPEHLMLKLTSGKDELSGKELMEMVRGMYRYNNYREESYFNNTKAFEWHAKFVHGVEQKLADFIGRNKVHLLSASEREAAKATGIKFVEHKTESLNQ